MTELPKRIRLSRAKGWRMPENAVKVDRSTHFGNPFKVGEDGRTAMDCVRHFHLWIAGIWETSGQAKDQLDLMVHRAWLIKTLPNLVGKDLACWCALDKPCHADVLLRIANEGLPPLTYDAVCAPQSVVGRVYWNVASVYGLAKFADDAVLERACPIVVTDDPASSAEDGQ